MAMAVSFFYVGPTALMPALNSYWRQIHVTSMIVASSLLGVGCLFTIVYLIKLRSEQRALASIRAQQPPPIMGASVEAADPSAPPDYAGSADEPVGSAEPGSRRIALPPSATLDALAYKFIRFGFPVWTFGVICGAIWAQQTWGRYWGWDPKETWSFITWVIFAGYLHARATAGWKGIARGGRRARRIRVVAHHVLRGEPVDRRAALVREVIAATHGRDRVRRHRRRWYAPRDRAPWRAVRTMRGNVRRKLLLGRRAAAGRGRARRLRQRPPA